MYAKNPIVFEREGGAGFNFAAKRRASRGRTMVCEYTVLIHRNEAGARGYWVDIPAVPGVVTGGDTISQALRRAREALSVHLEWVLEDGNTLPEDAPPRRKLIAPAVTQKIRVSLARR